MSNQETTLRERVAAAIWDTYVASPIVQEGSRDLTWADLCAMADRYGPGRAPWLYRETALAEADAAIAVCHSGTVQ